MPVRKLTSRYLPGSAAAVKRTVTILWLMGLSACGGGGSGTTTTNSGGSTSNALPGGIWTGSDSDSGLGITAIIDEAGDMQLIRSDFTQYVGTATTDGDSISASFGVFAEVGNDFPDGSTHGTGTLMGTIASRSSITATTQFKTDGGTSASGAISLTFNPLYNTASSLATISSNYTDPSTNDVYSVSSGGAVSWQDANTGCVGNGTISIINASYNAYRVQFSFADCTGASAVLNGVPFSGLASLDTASNPVQLLIGVSGEAGGINYGAVLVLNQT